MGKRSTTRKSVINYGHRTGTKRSDRHWTDPEGGTWDSRYEYLVWRAASTAKVNIRRTTKSDTFSFVLPIKRGKCGACGSDQVGQQRTYTPDFHVTADNPKHETEFYYIEAKGYLRPKERSLLRAFYKTNQDAPVRYLLQADFPAGARSKRTGKRSSITEWFSKFLPKAKVAVWHGEYPKEDDWRLGPSAVAKSRNARSKKVRVATGGGLPSPNAERGVSTDNAADTRTVAATVRPGVPRSRTRSRKGKLEDSRT
jgi:hypothetical protein